MENQSVIVIRRPHSPIRGPRGRRIIAAAVVLVLALLGVSLWRFSLRPLVDVLETVDMRWLTAALLANLAIFPFWIWQWRVLASRFDIVPWGVMGRVVALSLGARVAISGFGGVASGGAALHLEARLTPQQAASVMSLDQILAGLTKVLVLTLVLVFVPLPDVVWAGVLGVMAVFVAVLVGFAVLTGCMRWSASRIWQRPLVEWQLFKYIASFVQDFRKVASMPVLVPAGVLAVLKKTLEVMAAYAIQTALGIEGSWALALLVVASVSIVSLLPLAPVQLGPQALAVFSIYALFDTPTALAVSAGLVHQAVVLLTLGVVGLAALASGPVLSRFHGAS